MKKFKGNPYKEILVEAMHCRAFLRIQGFLTDRENDKVFERTRKFQDKHKIEVKAKEVL